MKNRQLYMKSLLVALICIFVTSCGQPADKDSKNGEKKIVTVQKKPNIDRFYYSGEIKPLKVESIISPEEGRVIATNFNYGQAVKVKQAVVTISSEKLQTTFHE